MGDTLRPGHVVSRRDETTLQVGLDRRVTLPDTPETWAVLDRLEVGALTKGRVVEALRARRLLVDARARDLASRAVLAAYGDDATRRLAQRAAASVSTLVLGDDPAHRAWGEDVAALLTASGVGRVSGTGGTPPDPAAAVALVLSLGEPDRERLDALVVTGQPHLLVVAHEGAARVGPFVVPGVTVCLRCVDAHLDERDGRRGIVLAQVAGAGVPLDPATAHAAAGLAVRDVLAYLDGDRPASWSATTTLDAAPEPQRVEWRRHPHCGCCWGDLLDE